MRTAFVGMFGAGTWLRNVALAVAAFAGQGVAAYWNEAPEVMRGVAVAAGVLYVCDFLGGSLAALTGKRFTSDGVAKGLLKLVAYMLSVLAGWAFGTLLGVPYMVTTWLLGVIAVREGASFVENSAALGFPWPQGLLDLLEKVQADAESGQLGEGEEDETE